MARNWLSTLRPASFRGIRFHVEGDGGNVGRRVAVHDISGGEAPVTEDMGKLAREVGVGAYVTGDAADLVGLALERACEAPGPSLLVLPIDAPRLVRCTGCRRRRDRDRAGYIAYDLDFVVAGIAGVALADPLSALRGVFEGALAGGAAALSGL